MRQGKSLLYQLLSLFEELYPAWVSQLKKNPAKKKKICEGYKHSVGTELNEAHLILLKSYLKSSLNTKYRTWPPPPLELLSIFDLNKKKLQNQSNSNLPTDFLTNFEVDQNSVPFLLNQFITKPSKIEMAPDHIRSYLEAFFLYKRTNPDFVNFLRLNAVYFKLRDSYPNYTIADIVNKMNNSVNYEFLCKELNVKKINIPEFMQFIKETRLNEEIFLYWEEMDDQKGDRSSITIMLER